MNLVEVKIRKKPRVIFGNVDGLNLTIGDNVIIKTEDALEYGNVVSTERMLAKIKGYKIIRKVTQEDRKKMEENTIKEKETFTTILQKISYHNLAMKLVDIEYTFDCSKLFIYYTSETRVDFRKLIKDLANLFKLRIQMVQIGSKDEAMLLGWIGICGRELCCRKILRDFISTSLEMVRTQNLTHDPPKLLGICGKLKCCLAFECDYYRESAKRMPKLNTKISTPLGEGIVIETNLLLQQVTVKYENGKVSKFHISELK